MPYLSLAGMYNKDLAAMLKGKDLPADLTWLAPMGTWSCVITPDEEGIQGYSASGIGNQGIFLAGALGGTAGVMQTMGYFPKPNAAGQTTLLPGNPAPPPGPLGPTPPLAPTPSGNASINAPDMTTNSAPVPITAPITNTAPASSNSVATPPIPDAATNSAPVTNSNPDAIPPTPQPAQSQQTQ